MISDEKEKGLVHIDDWKMTEADHLKTMGFDFDGDFTMSMKNPPMRVYKQKTQIGECFVIEEEKKPRRTFKDFEDLVHYFDHYSQPEIDRQK